MITHLLDTSALLAHFREEPGWERVEQWLGAGRGAICAISWFEFSIRLKTITPNPEDRQKALEAYGFLFEEARIVDQAVVESAVAVRQAARSRIPAIDCLIAGCALCNHATLVHRDPHMKKIPKQILKQWMLPEKSLQPTSVVPPKRRPRTSQ